jgi:CheY-like chemotaxis protein
MADTSGIPDMPEFERLVREALANLFDRAALATHPLANLIGRQGGGQQSRADQLRTVLVEAIEWLRPAGEDQPQPNSQAWRPYLLLHSRYVDGVSLPQIGRKLCVSQRQLRRDHSRAVQAVATHLRDSLFPTDPDLENENASGGEDGIAATFPLNPGPLDFMELLHGVVATVQRRAESEGAVLKVVAPARSRRVLADRVILRQVLFSMLSFALDVRDDGPVTISTKGQGNRLLLRIQFRLDDATLLENEEAEKALGHAASWCEILDVCLTRRSNQAGQGELTLSLPSADAPLLLVVDDQETAVRMFQRYLSHTNLRLVGVHDGSQVLPMAQRLQPQAVTLDIMMPNMDGWEVLQSLQADPTTAHIPVIVCSVWEEPELASSLGAADFLGKPIRRTALLTALARLNLLDT